MTLAVLLNGISRDAGFDKICDSVITNEKVNYRNPQVRR